MSTDIALDILCGVALGAIALNYSKHRIFQFLLVCVGVYCIALVAAPHIKAIYRGQPWQVEEIGFPPDPLSALYQTGLHAIAALVIALLTRFALAAIMKQRRDQSL